MAVETFKLIKDRGFYYQCTNPQGVEKKLSASKAVCYVGFDLTAKSLHVGSLLPIMLVRHLLNSGNKVIILFGGATTKIGDPSGRDKTRQILSKEQIEANKAGIKNVLNKFFDINSVTFVDNDDWLKDLNYLDFIRDVGRHFSINQMLSYESVKRRLDREQNLSFIEFTYMILQAYDFHHLAEEYGCNLQIGGSDQWGNIVNGIELHRKLKPGSEDLIGLTTELLATSDGKKMGKSEAGAIWLDSELLSPYEYYQYWRNISDLDTIKFIKLFTEIDLEQVDELAKLAGSELNKAKSILAYEATKICHGEKLAEDARNTSEKVFAEGLSDDNLPKITISENDLAEGMTFSALIAKAELVDSRSSAKRIIQGGGGRIDNESFNDPKMLITKDHFKNKIIKISAGKKKHSLVELNLR
ncbi:MAG: tyrosine--tRNA ligase [Rickettsiales bacterium]|nr:tyrosine--tRNA ligase [Rickettsiales bacterium]